MLDTIARGLLITFHRLSGIWIVIRFAHHDTIAAITFGPIERIVGCGQELAQVVPVMIRRGDAETGGDCDFLGFITLCHVDGRADLLGTLQCLRRCAFG